MSESGKYGVENTFYFPLLDLGDPETFEAGVTIAAGDATVMKDGGAFASTTNLFVDEGSGWYSITLTATEMQAARIAVSIVDQTATKEWSDQGITIDTYGHASAQHEFDLDTSMAALVDLFHDEALSGHQTPGSHGRAVTLAGVVLAETTLTGTPTTTTFPLTAGSAVDNYYNDMSFIILSGALAGSTRVVTDYDGDTKTVTVDEALTSAPVATDAVVIKATHNHSLSQIGTEVNTQVLDVLTVDTFAELASIPTGAATIKNMIALLFMALRNPGTQTSTTKTLRNEGDSDDVGTETITPSATQFTKGGMS